jgi:hypothetical protein
VPRLGERTCDAASRRVTVVRNSEICDGGVPTDLHLESILAWSEHRRRAPGKAGRRRRVSQRIWRWQLASVVCDHRPKERTCGTRVAAACRPNPHTSNHWSIGARLAEREEIRRR